MVEPDVPWVPTHEDVIDVVARLLKPLPGDTVYELGCGDGRVAIAIALRHKVPVICVELRHELARRARKTALEKGVGSLVKVVEANFFEIPLRGASIVYMYLLTRVNERLRPKLEKELERGTVVLSLDFPIPGWKPIGFVELPRSWQRMIYVYVRGYSDEGVEEGLEKGLARINRSVLTFSYQRLAGPF